MPHAIDNLIDRFKFDKPVAKFVPGALELRNSEKFSAVEIQSLLEQRHVFDDFPEDGRELMVYRMVSLVMSFLDGVNQEYQLYERKKLRFKREKVKLILYDNPTVLKASYLIDEKAIALSLVNLSQYVIQLSRGRVSMSFNDKINDVKLWGAEEANHSIYAQYKKEIAAELPSSSPIAEYSAQDHEYHGLIAKERMARRNDMPDKTIRGFRDLLAQVRANRAEKRARKK